MIWHPGCGRERWSLYETACFDFGAGVAGVAQAAGTVAAASIQANAAEHAADLQSQAAAAAAARLTAAGQTAQGYLGPVATANSPGYQNELTNLQANGTANQLTPITAATVAQTPGYQFTLQQGENAVTNSAAARGLANSGDALKEAGSYATGLAASTYNQQVDNQLAYNSANQGNITNAYNRVNSTATTGLGLSDYGLTAAQYEGQNALTAAGAASAYQNSGAASAAAGITGSANAIGSGLQNAANSYSQYSMYSQLMNGQQPDSVGTAYLDQSTPAPTYDTLGAVPSI